MNRRLPPADTYASVVIAAALGGIVTVLLVVAAQADRPQARTPEPAKDPYQTCIDAANTPGSAGFATEVCEPLAQGFQPPVVTLYPSDFGLDACATVPARADSDPIVYCPRLTP